MREILFRGKTKNGEWVEGFYYIATSGYAGSDEVIGKPCHMITTGRWQASGAYGERNELAEHRVIPESIGQYTGLTDKNGKRIFEGDIVINDYYLKKDKTKNSIIEYGEWNCSCCNGVYGWVSNGYVDFRDDDVIVIGNIHDNPELLEAE